MDGVSYLTEIKADGKYNAKLTEAFNSAYGTEAEVSIVFRVPKGGTARTYKESVTTFTKGRKSITLHEYLKEPGGLTDKVDLLQSIGQDVGIIRFNTYAEAEQEVLRLLKE